MTDLILVLDSYAWVEFFSGTSAGARVKELLARAEIAYTPSPVLLELANKYFREGFSREEVGERLDAIAQLSVIVEISKDILLRLGEARRTLIENARRLGIKRKPSIVDFFILACARHLGAKVVTGDEHFRGLPDVIFLKED